MTNTQIITYLLNFITMVEGIGPLLPLPNGLNREILISCEDAKDTIKDLKSNIGYVEFKETK
jgi:hypothetical protein